MGLLGVENCLDIGNDNGRFIAAVEKVPKLRMGFELSRVFYEFCGPL